MLANHLFLDTLIPFPIRQNNYYSTTASSRGFRNFPLGQTEFINLLLFTQPLTYAFVKQPVNHLPPPLLGSTFSVV